MRNRQAIAALLALTLTASLAVATEGDLDLISRTQDGAAANGASTQPALSGDGGVVVFRSDADNLSGEDDDAYFNVFARDSATGVVSLVSRATGASGAAAAGNSTEPAVSADGRHVAFRSAADNLSLEDNNAVSNVYVRDLATRVTTLVSRAQGPGGAGADGFSYAPAISADGRFVAFLSYADNLSAEDDNSVANVFVRDMQSDTTTLVSRASGPGGAGAVAGSGAPAISADGRYVAFASPADNLAADDDDAVQNVFLRDIQSQTTTLVSRATGAAGAAGNGDSFGPPSISADGGSVAFFSAADDLSPDDDDAVQNVFVRNLRSATTSLVSRVDTPTRPSADGDSTGPAISADGTRVAFRSEADNLSADDVDSVENVYVRFIRTGANAFVSRAAGPAGAGGTGASSEAAISGDGLHVAFSSSADNLSALDDDASVNVFRRELSAISPTSPRTPPRTGGTPRAGTPRCAGRAATIVGTSGPDVLRGTTGRDVIAALEGDDRVVGGGAGDLICLGAGADRAQGGGGRDRILGGPGDDRLSGGASRDVLRGGAGRDVLIGGGRTDVLRGEAGADLLIDGPRNLLSGGAGADRCRVGAGRAVPCR